MSNQVQIYDTTLRTAGRDSGTARLSIEDRVRIARRLDDLGVAYIEAGWPGRDPDAMTFIRRAQTLDWQHARLAVLGPTCHFGCEPAEDANLEALLEAQTPVCSVAGHVWSEHLLGQDTNALSENLRVIEMSVNFLKSHGREVIFAAEHFFEAFKDDADYALKALRQAIRAGVDTVVLCDTNGYTLPWEVATTVHAVRSEFPYVPFGIHAHNNGECAVANALAAVGQGAVHVQGTVNGYREWEEYADLCSVIPDLELRMGYACLPHGRLAYLLDVSHDVTQVVLAAPAT